jgi:diguanylate cyclase (GGDEF)-like protein
MFGVTSLGAKIAIAFALVLPICAWQLGESAYEALQSYRTFQLLERQNASANNLIAGTYEVLMERLAMNNALQADQPAETDVVSEIERHRSAAVQSIATALAGLHAHEQAHERAHKSSLLDRLNDAVNTADSYRAKSDAAIKQPMGQRDADTVNNLFKSLSELSAISRKLSSAVLSNTSRYDAELARLSNIRILGWNLHDIAELERSHVAQSISAKSAIPADKLGEIGQIRAQIDLMWRLLENNLDADDHAAIASGVRRARDGYFAAFQPLAEHMRRLSAEGARYPMTAAQWVATTTPQLYTLLEVMNGAAEASEARISAQTGAAFRSLVVSLTLLALAALAMLVSAAMVSRAVVRPLRMMTSAMRALADGKVDVAVPVVDRKDETGDMARAITVFRDAAVEKLHLEKEAEAARAMAERERLAREAEKAKEAAEAQAVISALGQGLGHLARGDQLCRIDEPFAPSFERLRADFNPAAAERYRHNREARCLSELNSWLQSCKSLDELYEMVDEFLSKMAPRCTGTLYVYANSRDVLEVARVWNGAQAGPPIHPDDCWGLRRGRTFTYGEGEIDFRCAHVGAGDGPHYCCIPVLAHGETIGLLHLALTGKAGADSASAREDMAEQRRLGLLCAEQISLAIANVRLRDQLRDQSVRDPLTGIFNRRYLMEACRRELARAKRTGQSVSVLCIDVDHFKKFNDNHGHDAGDTVLRTVSALLKSTFRDDDVPCRLGGEEFVVLLPGATTEVAAVKAEELRSNVEALTVRYLDSNLPRITISVGVAAFPSAGDSPQGVLKAADEALYRAKEAGRNRVELHVGTGAQLTRTDDSSRQESGPSPLAA